MKKAILVLLLVALSAPAHAGRYDDEDDDYREKEDRPSWALPSEAEQRRRLEEGIKESERRIEDSERAYRERQMIEEMRRIRENLEYQGTGYYRH